MSAAHIYNAVRQEELLSQTWKDMEVVLALHGVDSFVAGDRPTGLFDSLKNLALCMGSSVTNLGPNRRNKNAISSRDVRNTKPVCVTSRVFARRYTENAPQAP